MSADDFPRTTAQLRAALAEVGIHPKRQHGQHFLTDVQAVDAIARDADLKPGDVAIEVGTGPGVLTHVLAETGADVISYDVDPEIQAFAQGLRSWPERVRFETLDVLKSKTVLAEPFARAFSDLRPEAPGRIQLVSNLPYNAGTPILLGVLSLPQPPDRIVVMVQEEVGEKMLAQPGDSDYGVPSVAVGLKATGRVLRRFGPQVFWPRPKVRSVVIELIPRRPAPLAQEEQAPFGAFVTGVFTRRRKVLPTALRAAVPGLTADEARAALAAHDLAPTVRAEAVAPETFLALWRSLAR